MGFVVKIGCLTLSKMFTGVGRGSCRAARTRFQTHSSPVSHTNFLRFLHCKRFTFVILARIFRERSLQVVVWEGEAPAEPGVHRPDRNPALFNASSCWACRKPLHPRLGRSLALPDSCQLWLRPTAALSNTVPKTAPPAARREPRPPTNPAISPPRRVPRGRHEWNPAPRQRSVPPKTGS